MKFAFALLAYRHMLCAYMPLAAMLVVAAILRQPTTDECVLAARGHLNFGHVLALVRHVICAAPGCWRPAVLIDTHLEPLIVHTDMAAAAAIRTTVIAT